MIEVSSQVVDAIYEEVKLYKQQKGYLTCPSWWDTKIVLECFFGVANHKKKRGKK